MWLYGTAAAVSKIDLVTEVAPDWDEALHFERIPLALSSLAQGRTDLLKQR